MNKNFVSYVVGVLVGGASVAIALRVIDKARSDAYCKGFALGKEVYAEDTARVEAVTYVHECKKEDEDERESGTEEKVGD